jgi:hypothetical protein
VRAETACGSRRKPGFVPAGAHLGAMSPMLDFECP